MSIENLNLFATLVKKFVWVYFKKSLEYLVALIMFLKTRLDRTSVGLIIKQLS